MTTRTFWPADTDDEFYIAEYEELGTILERAANKWPGIRTSDLTISAEYIHTDCLGYGLYDAGDYTRFLKVSKSW